MFFKSIKFNPVKLFSLKMLEKKSSAEETLICSVLFSSSSFDVRCLQNINYEKLKIKIKKLKNVSLF